MTTMTSLIPGARQAGILESSSRLTRLLAEAPGTAATWWVELVAELDELSVRLLADLQTVWTGLQAQLIRDAPHLSAQLRRLDEEAENLQDRLVAARILAGRVAGDNAFAREIHDEVRDLLNRLRRFEERTTQLLYEAYERDLGGESA